MHLSGFKTKWGHFYDCGDEKRKKVEYSEQGHFIEIPNGQSVHVCSTGAKLAPTGVQGEFQLTALAEIDDFSEDKVPVYEAKIKWDSPVTRQRNVFNVTRAEDNTPKINFRCRDDYNKRGGALGNVDCKIDGVYKEKKVHPPPTPPAAVIEEQAK